MRTKNECMRGRRCQGFSSGTTILWSVLLLVSLVLALFSFIHITRQDSNDAQYMERAAEQRVLARRIALDTTAALNGDEAAFDRLTEAREKFETTLWELNKGTKDQSLPPSPHQTQTELSKVETAWVGLRKYADGVLSSKKPLVTLHSSVEKINQLIPELVESSESVIEALRSQPVETQQLYVATRQLMLAQRIRDNVSRMLKGGADAALSVDQFSRDSDQFGQSLDGLLNGDSRNQLTRVIGAAVNPLKKTSVIFTTLKQHVSDITGTAPVVLPLFESVGRLSGASDKVDEAASELLEAYQSSPGRISVAGIKVNLLLVGLLAAASLIFLGLLVAQLLLDAKRREEVSKAQNESNQKAILRLLDEMGDLADGDLTVTATVTEDITGAIADSINYAIEALRSLVVTINETSEQVSASAQESRATAMHLAEASEHQADQIGEATKSVLDITSAIDEVSQHATESAEVAQRSTEIAGKGANTVRRTIEGMDGIREQIQETSKRIKRLGESSQEIGDIVELIDDIADQTNILALNAAMQAAMAGEAGRGFAVVADEVQRLAERSSHATKQIEALVKTIQADTNEAVSSMEASTTGVVNGAKLAEDAGEDLMEIENVSNRIADLTRKIADSAQTQSVEAGKISNTMSVIQEITTQTSEGTGQTATSIGNLADLATELRRSVAGFRLPD